MIVPADGLERSFQLLSLIALKLPASYKNCTSQYIGEISYSYIERYVVHSEVAVCEGKHHSYEFRKLFWPCDAIIQTVLEHEFVFELSLILLKNVDV